MRTVIEVRIKRDGDDVGVESEVHGTGEELLIGTSGLANHIMRDLCADFDAKTAARMILTAVKIGLERYLEERENGCES